MPQRKSVLLIEDDQDYQDLVRHTLAGAAAQFDLTPAFTLDSGLACIERSKPDIILVDLNLPDSSGYSTFLRVRERAGRIPIIVLTGFDDDETAIHAVQDGAEDYVVKSQIEPRLIARCLNMALGRQTRQAPRNESYISGTVLSFIGTKGGVGTSTTAMNTAAVFAQNGFETVVIELQPGRPGTLSIYLQTAPRQGLNSLLEKAPETLTLANILHCTVEAVPGLHLLFPVACDGNWRSLSAAQAHAIVSIAQRAYRFVVLDLPARIDEGVAEALRLADSVVVIADRELASLHCGVPFVDQIRMAASRTAHLHVALADRTALEAPVPVAEVTSKLKLHPLAMIPAAGAAIASSHSARTPVVWLHPKHPFSMVHFEMAEHFLTAAVGPAFVTNRPAWRIIPETTYS